MNRKLWIKIVKLENQLIDFRFLIIKLENKCNARVEEANQAAQNAQFAAEDAELAQAAAEEANAALVRAQEAADIAKAASGRAASSI